MTRKAVCCCGRCSIEVDGEPTSNGICHCRNCKKRTGTAFGWSAYFADTQIVRKTGDFKKYEIAGKNASTRSFCGHCGTTLFWTAAFLPDHTGIAGGCFADDPIDAPTFSASDAGRCAWLNLPSDWMLAP